MRRLRQLHVIENQIGNFVCANDGRHMILVARAFNIAHFVVGAFMQSRFVAIALCSTDQHLRQLIIAEDVCLQCVAGIAKSK